MATTTILLEEGWNEINDMLTRIKERLNGGTNRVSDLITPDERIRTYALCYNMCTQYKPYNWSEQLYQRHGETIEEYLTATVLPSLQEAAGQGSTDLLAELQRRWTNHLKMTKGLHKIFRYLDRFYIKHHTLATLEQVGLRCFQSQIYDEIKHDTTAAILSLINQEREGESINQSIINSSIKLYEQMGMGLDFEDALVRNTREYYSSKREEWKYVPRQEYLINAIEAVSSERTRAANYLNNSTELKLFNVIYEELMNVDDGITRIIMNFYVALTRLPE